MKNKGFLGMIVINIIVILAFSVFLFKNEGIKPPVPTIFSSSLQSQIIGAINNTSGITVQIVAENQENYYHEDDSNDSLIGKQTILKKGSGIIASKTGYIITNKHVVDDLDLKYSIITNDGSIMAVKNIRREDFIDMAILYVENNSGNLSEAEFLDIDYPVNIGQFVFAVGNPLSEYPNSVSFGIISGKGRKIEVDNNAPYYAGLYQTDAAVSPGNSGGPLINLSGEVLGIITATSRGGNNIGFALPLNKSFISTTLDIIHSNNGLMRPYVGTLYTDTINGAKIDTILSNSPFQGKLSIGDVIIALDNRQISLDNPLLYYLYTYKPGDTVIFSVIRYDESRNSRIISFPIVLGQKTL